jgi:hypothetical protein
MVSYGDFSPLEKTSLEVFSTQPNSRDAGPAWKRISVAHLVNTRTPSGLFTRGTSCSIEETSRLQPRENALGT